MTLHESTTVILNTKLNVQEYSKHKVVSLKLKANLKV